MGVHDLNFRLHICDHSGFRELGVKHEHWQDTVCASHGIHSVEDLPSDARILAAGFDHFKNFLNESWFLRIVEYHKEIEILKRNLLNDEFRILYFEDFRLEPQKSLDSLCEFLEIGKIKKMMRS